MAGGMMEHGIDRAITTSDVKFQPSGTHHNKPNAWCIGYGKGGTEMLMSSFDVSI